MLSIKTLYQKYIYGVMGTLIFHILVIGGFLIAELNTSVKIEKEEPVLIDLPIIEEKEKAPEPEKQTESKTEQNQASNQSSRNNQSLGSNMAVNDAAKHKDKFFDAGYRRDIEEAQQMVADVNKQLSKKVAPVTKFQMPENTTEGQNPDSIKNVVYSGKSNIHYSLENRYHVRLPIPVYLTKGGGVVTVDIQVDRAGNVVKATARPASNINDPMLPVYATQAAENTVFNSESKAPAIQKGTITYKFVAQ